MNVHYELYRLGTTIAQYTFQGALTFMLKTKTLYPCTEEVSTEPDSQIFLNSKSHLSSFAMGTIYMHAVTHILQYITHVLHMQCPLKNVFHSLLHKLLNVCNSVCCESKICC